MKKHIKNLIFISFIFITLSCEKNKYIDDNTKIEIYGLLFNVKREIIIPDYSYYDENNFEYKINNSALSTKIDTINNKPIIKWETIDSPLTIVAISNDSLTTINNRITNINSIIWIWHNGMTSGKNGNINFLDGHNVKNGNIEYNRTPDNLEIGKFYFLNIWAFDYFGKKIKYSSKQKKIYVIR